MNASLQVYGNMVKLEMYPFSNFYSSFAPLPRNAVMLGRCNEDGLPVFYDMSGEHTIRPISIKGDIDDARYVLFSVVLSLLNEGNTPHKVIIVSKHPEQWEPFYCKVGYDLLQQWVGVAPSYKEDAQQIISYVAQYACNQRSYDDEKILLLVDDYDGILSMDFSFKVDFKRILLNISKKINVIVTAKDETSLLLPATPYISIVQNKFGSFSFEDCGNREQYTFSALDFSK